MPTPVDAFVGELEALDLHYVQAFFEEDWLGSCPCFAGKKEIGGETLEVEGRCWRVSENDQDLYVGGTLRSDDLERIAQAIKKNLDEQEWYHEYTIVRGWEK